MTMESPDAEPRQPDPIEMARPPRRRDPRWIELSVGFTAVVVSIAALFVAQRQTRLMDRQLAASVWPVIDYSSSNRSESGSVITLDLRNGGVGPTRIRSFRVAYEGQPMRGAAELLERCCVVGGETGIRFVEGRVVGRVLPAGETITFLSLAPAPGQEQTFAALDRARAGLDVRACYCSVLEECWVARSGGMEPEPVESCAREEALPQYR